jgi:hypothetical protein
VSPFPAPAATEILPSSLVPGATVSATPRQLVIRSCSLYAGHRTPVLEGHHVAPASWWRAAHLDPVTPLAYLCGLCHNNTHAALDAVIRGLLTTGLPPRTVALAHHGLVIAREHGLTPKPTL